MPAQDMIEVQNINTPGRTARVNAEKYEAMRKAMVKTLPKKAPGLTFDEMVKAVKPKLPQTLWPNGEKAGWWVKTVQLDLEAKGAIKRDPKSKPLRWWRA